MSGAYLFIEALDFTDVVVDYFGSEEAYADFQSALANNPNMGNVIPGAAPL